METLPNFAHEVGQLGIRSRSIRYTYLGNLTLDVFHPHKALKHNILSIPQKHRMQ